MVRDTYKTSYKEREAFKKAAQEFFLHSGLPEKVREALSKKQPGRMAKFLVDADLLKGEPSPLAIFEKMADQNPAELLPNGLKRPKKLRVRGAVSHGFHKWATAYDLKTVTAAPAEKVDLVVPDWFELGRMPTVEDILELVKYRRDVEFFPLQNRFIIDHSVVDLDKLTVNGKAAKPILLVNPGNKVAQAVNEIAAMYFVLSHACNTGSVSASLDLTFGRVFDPESMDKQDEATQLFFNAKTPVFYVDFTPQGFKLTDAEEGQAAAAYAKITAAATYLSAHYQGDYFYDLRSGALPMTVDLEEGMAYLASEALEKMWKRHTVLYPVAVSLENPDTGYMRASNGETHKGRRMGVLNVVGGVNLPYLGMASSVVSREQLANILKPLREVKEEFVWQGDYTSLVLPEVGAKVAQGQTLIEGAPEGTPAQIEGTVEKVAVEFDGYKTYIDITVVAVDRTGQAKIRSLGGGKYQLAVVGLTGINWQEASEVLGFALPQRANGDFVVISGLKPEDDVKAVLNTDSSKIYGKTSSAAGVVALAAETTKTVVNYRAKDHYEGKYDPMIDTFMAEGERYVETCHALTEDVAEDLLAANRPDAQVRGYSNLATRKATWVLLQQAKAYFGYDLVKVEYTSVEASLTTSRFMLETAAMARTMGLNAYSKEIFEGGNKAYQLVKRIYNVVRVVDGKIRFADGKSLNEAGLKEEQLVRTDVAPSPEMAELLRSYSQKPKSMKETLVFADIYNCQETGRTIIREVVAIDPDLIRQLGTGRETLGSIFAQLCYAIAGCQMDLANSLIARCRGKVEALADAQGTAKRLNRGAEVVICKTVAGMTPDGWVAMSAHGEVAKTMAKVFGFSSVEEMLLSGLLVGSAIRSPQNAPLPVKFWCPDVDEALWLKLVSLGLVPEGACRSQELLEPHRVYMSPRDSAWCHGDHDGDLRAFHISRCRKARMELLAFNVEEHRVNTLKVLQSTFSDPVTEAFVREEKKLVIATKAVKKPLEDLHKQNKATIHHQTVVLGQAYELAFLALCASEANPGMLAALLTHAMWVGTYEVNLGGADELQIRLFGLLQKNPFVKEDETPDWQRWEDEIFLVVEEIGWTKEIGQIILTANKEIKAAKAVENGYDSNPLSGMALVDAIYYMAYRRISKGCYAQGKLDELISLIGEGYAVPVNGVHLPVIDAIREKASQGMVAARVLLRFFDEVYSLIVSKDAGRVHEEEDYFTA